MALDLSVVSDIKAITASVEQLATANDRAQRGASGTGKAIADGMRKARGEIRENERWWKRHEATLRANERAASQAGGAAGMAGKALQGLQAIAGPAIAALGVSQAIRATWDDYNRQITNARQGLETLRDMQDIATGAGLGRFGAELNQAAVVTSTQGGYDVPTLTRAAGAFVGTAKDAANLDNVTRLMQRAQLAAAAGVKDPTSFARATGSLVEAGMDVDTASNLAQYITEKAGEDSQRTIMALRNTLPSHGAQNAEQITAMLLAAGPKGLERVVGQLEKHDLGRADWELSRRGPGQIMDESYGRRLQAQRASVAGASDGFLESRAHQVLSSNPLFAAQIENQMANNQAAAAEFTTNSATALRQDSYGAARRRILAQAQPMSTDKLLALIPEGSFAAEAINRLVPSFQGGVEHMADQLPTEPKAPPGLNPREMLDFLERIERNTGDTASRAGRSGGGL